MHLVRQLVLEGDVGAVKKMLEETLPLRPQLFTEAIRGLEAAVAEDGELQDHLRKFDAVIQTKAQHFKQVLQLSRECVIRN